MFKSIKKKAKPKRIRTAEGDGSDDQDQAMDENPPDLMQLKQKLAKPDKRKRTTVVRTTLLVAEEGVDQDESSRRATKKTKKKGVGLGGAALPSTEVADQVQDQDVDIQHVATSYSKDALSQLVSEQKVRPIDDSKSKEQADHKDASDFVPLDGRKMAEPEILTGEEALKMEDQGRTPVGVTDQWPLDEMPSELNKTEQLIGGDQEESSAWEAQVTRRAGVSNGEAAGDGSRPPPPAPSVAHFHDQVVSTGKHLLEQRDELHRAQRRREAEAAQTRSELERQQKELTQSGNALEYYQYLRATLTTWVGALRELDEKVKPIQKSLHNLEGDVAANHRWMEWEDDSISLLREAGMLDEVLGRQPADAVFDTLVTIDEFGRDVKSQQLMQREKRVLHRRKVQNQRSEPVRGDESDAFLDEEEQEEFRERHVALQQALDVALEGLEEEYSKLQNLVTVFQDWHAKHFDEYKRTYANLSLADLASVLVRAELCSLNDPWDQSEGYNEAKWVAVVHAAYEAAVLDSEGIERLVEKAVLPTVVHFLKKSGYNLLSTRQSRSLNRFYLQVQKLLPKNSPVFEKLRHAMTSYIGRCLKEISIPILTKTMWPSLDDEDLKEAYHMATWGQTYRIQKVLHNLLFYWTPILPLDGRDDSDTDEFIELILDFCANKFLFLLSSLKDVECPRFAASPADIYGEIWKELQSAGWLDRPEWMIQSMALRAAATAYGIKT